MKNKVLSLSAGVVVFLFGLTSANASFSIYYKNCSGKTMYTRMVGQNNKGNCHGKAHSVTSGKYLWYSATFCTGHYDIGIGWNPDCRKNIRACYFKAKNVYSGSNPHVIGLKTDGSGFFNSRVSSTAVKTKATYGGCIASKQ